MIDDMIEEFGKSIHLQDKSINCAIAIEVLEHCPAPGNVLEEAFRVLMPGGKLFLTVPFLWPLHDVPNDEYRYTPFAFKRLLDEAGFMNVDIQSMGGWDASLAQMLALWARRRPMSKSKRRIASTLILPLVKFLLSKDRKQTTFAGGDMITGICARAQVPIL